MRTFVRLAGLLAAVSISISVHAQSLFVADGDSAQVVPPVPTHNEYFTGAFKLQTTFGQTKLLYDGIASVPLSRIDIFEGKMGTMTTRRLDSLQLVGNGRRFFGVTRNISFTEIGKLKRGNYYVQAVTAGTNQVIIRGQLLPNVRDYAGFLDGPGAKPPTPSAAEGTVEISLDYQNTSFTYTISDNVPNRRDWKLLDQTNPSRELILNGNQGTVNNFSWVDTIAAGEAELVVTSQTNPNGEIGGCVVPTGIPYSKPCRNGPTLSLRGAPTSRSDITIEIKNATPGSQNLVYVGTDRAAGKLLGCKFVVGGPLALFIITVDNQGNGSFTLQNINLQNAVTVYLQAIDQATTDLTNGLQVDLGNCP